MSFSRDVHLLKIKLPRVVSLPFISAVLSDEQPLNALLPSESTVSGTVTSVRPVQPANAESPIVVSFSPNTAFLMPVQSAKAELPTDTILSVITFSVRDSHFPNEPLPSSVTLSGIIMVSTSLKP